MVSKPRETRTERGIDFDAEQAARATRELEAQPTVLDYEIQDAVANLRTQEAQRTVIDHAAADGLRKTARDLAPTPAAHGERTVIDTSPAAKVTQKPRGFLTDLVNAPRDAWRMVFGKPPVIRKGIPLQEARTQMPFEDMPIQTAGPAGEPTVFDQDPNETTFFRVDVPAQRTVEAPGRTEMQETFARVEALRQDWVSRGLMEQDGTVTDALRLYPDKNGIGAEDYALLERVSRRQGDAYMSGGVSERSA